jgi:ubiquinone/menaquinone biosynthesis C-methylase UbiE
VPRGGSAVGVDGYYRQRFARAPIQPQGDKDEVDVLIAGCGTGQHSIRVAQQFRNAQVLAVDLSLTSLSYAKRKTAELGLSNIEYAQADIMQLGGIGRSFDVIEAGGVLHHLADPVAGWRVLLGLLRPRGYMQLGFYSEIARQSVVAGREFIAEKGYSPTAQGIRQCRQELMSGANAAHFAPLLTMNDFFGTSPCRDLLFHVQEHRYTLLQLQQIIYTLGVRFIGLNPPAGIDRQYLARFPDDPAQTDLNHWHTFETENPDTFIGMYQFVVQKPG